ncbi:MAG: penicillin-binding protein 2 [Candidatus Omnitrophota bacterium]
MKATRLTLLMLAGFSALVVNLVWMQVIRGGVYRALSEKNRIRVIFLEPPRGRVLDRKGEVLATSRLSFNCSAIHREANPRIRESCAIVGPILGVDPAELEKRFLKRKAGAFNTVLLAEDIPAAQAIAIEERLDFLPGFLIETRPQRIYPYGESAAHLVGFTGPLMQEEVDVMESRGYRQADWLGRDGVEKMYEETLRGLSGGLQIEVDSRGRLVRALGVKEPKEGKDVQLTIDAKLQSYVQGLLKERKGAVLVLELKEGGLLAVNSSPSFDSNLFASTRGRKEVGKYLHGTNSPMVNRGLQGQYPPGSIFKIVTALAALDGRKITPATTFQCAGYSVIGGNRFRCWNENGHGPQCLAEAFAHSCNVYFYRAGLAGGADTLFAKAVEFGFSKTAGIDLPGEKRGFVPSREWKNRLHKGPWYDGETANLAIGQGSLQVTPLQAVVMIAAVATDGQILKPHVIDKIQGMKAAERRTRPMTVSRHWKAIKEGLDQVVNSDTGTGRLAQVPGVRIAGKTGTAQSGQDRTHAWFVGFAPEEDPKVAMVVFLEHGGRGGVNAAGVAAPVWKWLKDAKYL